VGLIGSLAKAILLATVVFWIWTIVELIIIGQPALALLLLVGLLIPSSMLAYDYWKQKKVNTTTV
jgi:hypothetical protein